jgi:chromosome segregation ATPase
MLMCELLLPTERYDESKLDDTRKALQRVTDQVKSHERKLRGLEVTVKSAADQLQDSEKKLQVAKDKAAAAAAEREEKQDAFKAQRTARDKLVRQHEELAERATAAVERAELLQTEMHEILQRAQVDGVHVPTLGEKGGRGRGGGGGGGGDSSESGTEAGGGSSSSATSGSQDELGHLNSTARSKQRAAIERVDFEQLEDQDIVDDRGEYDARLAQWGAQVKALAAELDEMQPNLRAAELYKDVLGRIRDSDADYAAAKDEVARLTEGFEKVRADRRNAFMKCFNHVSNAINGVYMELTQDAAFPQGGNASLSLDGPALVRALPTRDTAKKGGGEEAAFVVVCVPAGALHVPANFVACDVLAYTCPPVRLPAVSTMSTMPTITCR